MASTREERLQMRQRGAGTRKIQQVDFGFSFGGVDAGPSGQTPSLFPEPAKPPQVETASAATPLPPKTSQPESQTRRQSEHTPGSARNNFPQRASTYDIPLDDGPEEPRSNKRRKINPPDNSSGIPSREKARKYGGGDLNEAQNGTAVSNETLMTQAADVSLNVDNGRNSPDTGAQGVINDKELQTATQTPSADSALQTTVKGSRKSISRQAPIYETEAIVEPTESASTQQRQRKSSSPRVNRSSPRQAKEKKAREQTQHTTRVSKGGREPKTKVSRTRPTSSSSASEPDLPETRVAPKDNPNGTGPEPATGTGAETEGPPQKQSQASRKTQRRKSRSPNGDTAPQHATEESTPTNNQSKKSRGKRPAHEQTTSEKTTKGKATTRTTPAPEPQKPDQAAEAGPSEAVHGKAGKKSKKAAEPKPAAREEQPEAEADPPAQGPSKSRRGKANKKPAAESDSPAARTENPSNSEVPQPESQQPQGSGTQAVPGPSKVQAGRRGRKGKKSAETEATTGEEQPEPEKAQEERRKPREPRGETVPVTVHRLVNPSALGGMHTSVDSGDENDESAAQTNTQDMDKLPNRGGVNPADVLGQICRETLEKTLTALQNGISNETNTQRRAEWTRKRKAVEAFGSELDSRLLDLSEMLDSNFVLGVQLKKAKREMMDLRGRLYKVRQERESLTLQMDAVRGKHMEEETAKLSRTTINNSLHSLDLALDRRQNRTSPTAEPSSADLEFMLRTVADDVSCRAPGAQGGLLNQIRAFNAQLEATARRMES